VQEGEEPLHEGDGALPARYSNGLPKYVSTQSASR
jgi:hypothetical protein